MKIFSNQVKINSILYIVKGTKTHTSAVYVVFPLEYRLIPTLLDLPPQSALIFAHPKNPKPPFFEVTKAYKCLSGAL